MTSIRGFTVLAAGFAVSLAATAASADVIQASHTPQLMKNVNVTSQDLFGTPFSIVPTSTFLWTRADVPAAGSEIPATFEAFCLEANVPVSAGTVHEYEVLTLEQAGYSAAVRSSLARLWSNFRDQANTIDTSAAFQVAVWEIVHDEGLDVTSGSFTFNSLGDTRDTAQAWLNAIAGLPDPDDMPQFRVLRSETAQDQLMVVPAPGAAAMVLGAAGVFSLGRRRR